MRILIAGDSLGLPRPKRINNYSPKESTLAVSYGETYASIVNKELLLHFDMNPYIEVINRSRRFQTIKGVAEEFSDHLFFYEPNVIIMQVGIVDCWFRDELNGKQMIDRKSYQLYLNNILDIMSNRPECKLIIIGICPTSIKMQKKYPGINREIRLYNQLLKSVIDYKNIFYIDMQQYIDPHNSNKYLLPDDHHLNKDGNYLIAKEILCIIKGIIYSELGVNNYNQNNTELAMENFKKSYHYCALNAYNLYNLMVLYYEDNELDKVKDLIQLVKKHRLDYSEINRIIEVIEERINR